ncbi:MAG: SH3 domain-containing protein, partial [Eubacteriales bacterium]|nr:SH3 domain-containing protein [Eubacteriales bacterium]
TEIKLVGENIWGKTSEFKFVEDTDNTENSTQNYNGWVNLASKYVKRVNAPTIEGDKTNHNTGKVATVINTDSVRVRDYGSTSGKVIGSLSRGSTVAVWETNEDGDWFKIDTNKNGTYDYEEDGWVYGDYLNITEASTGSSSGSDSSNGTTNSSSGTGIVANTYSGVNVRASAGISGTFVCKLLPGTQVEILETTTVGAAKWGRVAQGWVCMDYIAMISYDDIPGNSSGTTNTSNGTAVDSLDKVDKTTTTAVYTGKITDNVNPVNVYATPALKTDALEEREIVNVLNAGDPITMYELVTVTETYEEKFDDEKENDKLNGGTTTATTVTSYWARVNGGYIYDPEHNLTLDALDEKVHTLTGSDTLNVRKETTASISSSDIIDKLEKGDQVSVTALKIEKDKVWGRIKLDDNAAYNYGWIRLDYMSEGAYYVNQTTTNNNNNTGTASTPVIGSTGNTGTAGIANNTSGYKYTGKVINTESVNVRTYASCNDATSPITTTLKRGASLVIYETTTAENMAWGRCDAGWVYLYYVDLTPSGGSAIDARVVYNDNTIVYTDTNCSEVAGTYARMSVIDIYEVVGSMVRTDLGWVNTSDLL